MGRFLILSTLFVLASTSGIVPGPAQALPIGPAIHGPPSEAINTCIGRGENTPCSFTSPHGDTISGRCFSLRGALACVPMITGPRNPWGEKPSANAEPAAMAPGRENPLAVARPAPSAIVDTGQDRTFDSSGEIPPPREGEPFFGQDAQYQGKAMSFRDNKDGTITDLNTGLMWEKTPDFKKRTLEEAEQHARLLNLARYHDWRLPTIKELFSIADFRGNINTMTPYIDTRYFSFIYPDSSEGGRIIDAQYRSSTRYPGTTMRGDRSVFGFNFADGRIKSYPEGGGMRGGGDGGRQYVRCVRGPEYGKNALVDNGDNTVTDQAHGLMWMRMDSGSAMNWQEALAYAENLTLAGHSDWRLPNVKELQSIVEYGRAPEAYPASAKGPAIDPIFELSNPESWFWSSTTHQETGFAYYVAFGRAFSVEKWLGQKMDAHGAGAVRSDPKSGDPARWEKGLGPQNDEIRIYNYVRCVRSVSMEDPKNL